MTLRKWRKSGCKLEDCLHIGEEIDNKMAAWLTKNFPQYDPDIVQLLRSEAGAVYDVDGAVTRTYNTFSKDSGKWRYAGRCFIDETQNKHNIYLLFYCNEWKEWSSMRIAATTTNPLLFRRMLKSFIESGDMEYCANSADLDTMDLAQINSCLQYGHIIIEDDGTIEK